MLTKIRHTAAETFIVRYGDGYRERFISVGRALRMIEARIPAQATLVFLPASLSREYTKEIHLYRAPDGSYQPIEIAIRKVDESNGDVTYEYSTDYEVGEPHSPSNNIVGRFIKPPLFP